MKISRRHDVPQHRRGFLSLELAVTLPILLIVLFALLEFSLLFFARSEVVEACRAGARRGTLSGVSLDDVRDEVRRTLPPRLRDAAEVTYLPGDAPGDSVSVTVIVPMGAAAPDLLWPIGFGLEDQELIAASRMAKE